MKAVLFATKAHGVQKRKNEAGDPYITHPIEVAVRLRDAYIATKTEVDYDVIIAAILHDVVEDTPATLKEVAIEFGDRVGGIVSQVTDDKSLPKLRRKQIQLEIAPKISTGAALVKMADKWHNCKDLKTDPPKGWSDKEVEYYMYWSYAICNSIRDAHENQKVIEHFWYNCVYLPFVEHFGLEHDRVDAVVQEYFEFLQN